MEMPNLTNHTGKSTEHRAIGSKTLEGLFEFKLPKDLVNSFIMTKVPYHIT
jgi:hypothetical protein